MEEKLKSIVDAVTAALGEKNGREIVVALTSDEFLELNSQPVQYRVFSQQPFVNVPGNFCSYRYLGTTVHFKIDTNLK
jgi:hypothetical protein